MNWSNGVSKLKRQQKMSTFPIFLLVPLQRKCPVWRLGCNLLVGNFQPGWFIYEVYRTLNHLRRPINNTHNIWHLWLTILGILTKKMSNIAHLQLCECRLEDDPPKVHLAHKNPQRPRTNISLYIYILYLHHKRCGWLRLIQESGHFDTLTTYMSKYLPAVNVLIHVVQRIRNGLCSDKFVPVRCWKS